MAEPKVSVIIPTYNQRDFVRETIDSVLAQTYNNIEIIVTDDGSIDGTREIIQEYASQYPEKIKPVYSEKNTGIAANINRGLAVRTGEFIAWLGGDDIMLPEKIQKQVDLLIGRPDAVGCCHDAEVFESDTGKKLGLFSELYNGKRGFTEGGVELWFRASYRMLPSSVMIRSALCPAHGFDERLKYMNDWLFDVEVFRRGTCAVINEVLVKYRRHASNITANPAARGQTLEETLIVLGIVTARYPELHRYVKQRRKSAFLTAAAKAYSRGELLKFNRYIKILLKEGVFIRTIGIYLGVRLFGKYVSQEINKLPHERHRWLKKLMSI